MFLYIHTSFDHHRLCLLLPSSPHYTEGSEFVSLHARIPNLEDDEGADVEVEGAGDEDPTQGGLGQHEAVGEHAQLLPLIQGVEGQLLV